ncbi:DUF4124 domain-containing protein [uncultured Pseudomonas sp.]|uniref:DUF4124 domain-containing protein n=1 Tax=uncultured Pseudomonas sp. TaxID=114707 RepID=UPI0025E57F02|nr:DUF4124 domain-containing protein [uncultured Pseudomonas sp.]
MRHLMHPALLSALLCLPVTGHAGTIQRCEDAAGHVTFTSLGCDGRQASRTVDAYNPLPGSVTPEQLPERYDAYPSKRQKEIVVVGQRDDGCGNRLSPEQRRLAIIDRRTPPGMTRSDVENLLGRPDRITQRNGELRYHYAQKNGRSNQVSFDPQGCVKGK